MIKLNLPNTKYNISYSSAMKKDLKRAEKRGYDMTEIAKVIFKLANDEVLELARTGTHSDLFKK